MPTTEPKEHTMYSTTLTVRGSGGYAPTRHVVRTRDGQSRTLCGRNVPTPGQPLASRRQVNCTRCYKLAFTSVNAYAAGCPDTPVVPASLAPAAEPAADHRVVAVLADGNQTKVAASHPLTWDAAQAMWRQLDDLRVAGHMPHVAYYAVRSTDDPQWQGLRVDQRVLVPHADHPANLLPQQRPTQHQAGVLARLVRRSTGGLAPQRVAGVLINSNELRWVRSTSCGGPMALYHLYRKGYAEQDVRMGPRGGEHVYYRPTQAGVVYVAREQARRGLRGARRAA